MTNLVDIEPLPAAELGLPRCYDTVETYLCTSDLSVDVEVAQALAALETARGRRPTVVFGALRESPHTVLGNPYPRSVLLAALRTTEGDYLEDLHRRLNQQAEPPVTEGISSTGRETGDLLQLPAVRHRPGDVGRYLTAAVAVTRPPDASTVNLGVYRAWVTGSEEMRIFMNPRADGHRNMRLWHEAGHDMPIAIFLGADPVYAFLGGAEKLYENADDYALAARLLTDPVTLQGDPPVPKAPYVIRGRVTPRLAAEGPFGEFKGFYMPERLSHVLVVEKVEVNAGAPMPFIVPGAESGVALTQLQAEIKLFGMLRKEGFNVRSVRYPSEGLGRYLLLVESDTPGPELLDAIMRLDRTAKMALCGQDLRRPWAELSEWPSDVRVYPYARRGEPYGQRIGMTVRSQPGASRVEY